MAGFGGSILGTQPARGMLTLLGAVRVGALSVQLIANFKK
jgi:hypothetical protein